MPSKDILLRIIPDDAVIVYICPGCERSGLPGIVATSDTYDPLALRAHQSILGEHMVHYQHGPILTVDLLIGQITNTIPATPRLS